MKDPAVRARVAREMRTPTDAWESLLLLAGSPDKVLLVAFKQDSLKHAHRQDARRGGQAARHKSSRKPPWIS